MRASIVITSLFAAFVAAAPAAAPVELDSSAVEVEARQSSIRVQLSDDATDTATQASIAANGNKFSIKANFRGLPNNSRASRAQIVDGSGSCTIFKDANAQQKVVTIKSGGQPQTFTAVALGNGVIVCK